MHTTVEGTYRNGRVELAETPHNVGEDTRVLVTFLTPGRIDLQALGISEAQTAELRSRLSTFAEDWDSPEMSDYDDYEANHSKPESR